jgi:hypothetical protein
VLAIINAKNIQDNNSKCLLNKRAAKADRFNSLAKILFFIFSLKSVLHGLKVTRLKTQSKAWRAKARWVALKMPKMEKIIKAKMQNIICLKLGLTRPIKLFYKIYIHGRKQALLF